MRIRPNGLSVNRFNTFKVIFGCLKCIRLKFGYPFFIVIILVCFRKEWYFSVHLHITKVNWNIFLLNYQIWNWAALFKKFNFFNVYTTSLRNICWKVFLLLKELLFLLEAFIKLPWFLSIIRLAEVQLLFFPPFVCHVARL